MSGMGKYWRIMDMVDLRLRHTVPGRTLDLLSVGDTDKANLS